MYRVNSSIADRRRVVVRFRTKLCNGLTSILRGIPGKQTGTARSTCLSKLSVGEFCRMGEERIYEPYTVCRNGHGHVREYVEPNNRRNEAEGRENTFVKHARWLSLKAKKLQWSTLRKSPYNNKTLYSPMNFSRQSSFQGNSIGYRVFFTQLFNIQI